MEWEDRGEESEDERELEEDAYPPLVPAGSYSQLPDLIPVTPSTPSSQPMPAPHASHSIDASGLIDTPSIAGASAAADISGSASGIDARTRKQKYAKALRARKRAAEQGLEGRRVKNVALKRLENMNALQVDRAAEDLGAASTGWIGGRIPSDRSSFTLEEVTQAPYNLRHVRWDGR
jgi:hypothetical protein